MGYWPSVRSRLPDIGQVLFFVCLWTKQISWPNKLGQKRFIIWLLGKFFLWDTAGCPERARWLHLARSGSQSRRAIWVILPDRGASHIVRWVIDQVWSWDGWILVIQALFCVCLFTETQWRLINVSKRTRLSISSHLDHLH